MNRRKSLISQDYRHRPRGDCSSELRGGPRRPRRRHVPRNPEALRNPNIQEVRDTDTSSSSRVGGAADQGTDPPAVPGAGASATSGARRGRQAH